jgi:hypothetical protein
MDLSAAAAVFIPTLSAVTGLVSALAALNTSRKDLHTISTEATRTGISAAPGTTSVAVELAMELANVRAELVRRGGGSHG